MNAIDFYKLSGLVSATSKQEFKKELSYRYGILSSTPYFDPVEQNNPSWAGENFSYDFNEFGFRDSAIGDTVDTCYYGCSITVGIGVPETDRWTNILDSRHGWKSNNFGIPGVGVEECSYLFAQTSRLVKMDRAVFFLSGPHRHTIAEYTDTDHIEYFRVQPNFMEGNVSRNNTTNIYNTTKLLYQLPETYAIDRARTAINLIRYIAELKNIQVVFLSWNPQVFNLLKYPNDFVAISLDHQARDNQHPGIDYHRRVADQFETVL